MGFAREPVNPVGSIELLVTTETFPRQATIMVKFSLMDRPLAYNAIIWRVALNELKVITSTPHLKMKFLTGCGVGEVRGYQRAARQCYNVFMKECPDNNGFGQSARKMENSNYKVESWSETWSNSWSVDFDKKVKVGFQLDPGVEEELVAFLPDNHDVFSWSHEHMPGIDPSVMVHKLNVNSCH